MEGKWITVKEHQDPWFGMPTVKEYDFLELLSNHSLYYREVAIFLPLPETVGYLKIYFVNENGALPGNQKLPTSFHPNIFLDYLVHQLRATEAQGLYVVFDVEEKKILYSGDSYYQVQKLCRRR